MANDSVSLYITVLNEADTIQPLLESIAKQTRPPDQIVVVDGGSSDGTIDRIRDFISREPTVTLVELPGSNVSEARNTGVLACSNNLIASIDGGCVADAHWLERLVDALTPDIEIVSGVYVPEPRNLFERCVGDLTFPKVETLPDDWNMPSHRSVLFRRTVWEAIGGFPQALDRSEDTWFDLEASKRGFRFRLAREAIVYWRPRRNLVEVFSNAFRWTMSDVKHSVSLSRLDMSEAAAEKSGGLAALAGICLAVPVLAISPGLGVLSLAALCILAIRPFRILRLFRRDTSKARLLKNLILVAHSSGWLTGYIAGLGSRVGSHVSQTRAGSLEVATQLPQRRPPACDGLIHIASIDWDWLRARQQHLTERMAVNRKTLFVERMLSTNEAIKRGRLFHRAGDSLWILSPFKFVPFESRSKLFVRANRVLLSLMIRWAMAMIGVRCPIIMYSTFDDHDLPVRVPHSLILYDCVDRHESFSWATETDMKMESRILGRADLVIASSKNLVDSLRRRGVEAHLVRNAADVEFFKAARGPGPVHDRIATLPRPRIGFVGYIADWVDLDLLDFVATAQRSWHLVLAGRRIVSDHPVFLRPNVTYVGSIPYADLPALFRGLDVCLIPFRNNPLTEAADTIKLYEYLSAGKAVVATSFEQTIEFSEFIYLATTPTEFTRAIALALQEGARKGKDLDALLEGCDWAHRAQRLEELIRHLLLRNASNSR